VKESKNIPQDCEAFPGEQVKYIFIFTILTVSFLPLIFMEEENFLVEVVRHLFWYLSWRALGVLLFMSFNDGKILKIVALTAKKPVWVVSCSLGIVV
jgi:hypothetical protein